MRLLVPLLILCAITRAHADDKPAPAGDSGGSVELYLEVKPPDPKDPKQEGQAPNIEATVIGGAKLPIDKFTLREDGAKEPIELHATTKRDFMQGSETVAIALVMNTWEVWVGNDDVTEESDPSRYQGVLKGLSQALDGVKFTEAGPPGSQGTLITYADKAAVKIKMGPLSNITGSALGSQKEYQGTKGQEMVKGVELAMAELHNVTAARKVLIIVCDGNDTNNDAAKATLKNDRALAAKDHIQTFAIIYKGALSDPAQVIGNFTSSLTTVNTADNIASTIAAILARMNDRFYLTFPGFDPKTGLGLSWDGKVHKLILKIDKDDQDPVEVTMAPVWSPPKHGSWLWLFIVIGAVVLLLLIIIIVVATRKKPIPMPEPVAVAAPVQELPKPAGPMRTVALSAGGGEDGFPIVGWLVPLNGANAYQTLRLRSGLTKIGTQQADLNINDGFMSTEHCQISCSPNGFTLIDGGSTNGSYVNDKRVSRHDLVDNDTITLGKTNFKFKSIS